MVGQKVRKKIAKPKIPIADHLIIFIMKLILAEKLFDLSG